MADDNRPIIVKRKKVIAGGGHHGGAWKVAYADFVTAMMAFFLLMWLLNATTEEQRKGIADYFNPSIPIHRTSGGGDGAFGGPSVTAELTLAQNGTGATREKPSQEAQAKGETGVADSDGTDNMFTELESELDARGGESVIADSLLKHVRTRVTDEGLVIEIFELEESPLFDKDGVHPNATLRDILILIADVSNLVTNKIAVTAHLKAVTLEGPEFAGWTISTDRALISRQILGAAGIAQRRFAKVIGQADRAPRHKDRFDIRNSRLEITLLRADLD
ncbi:flagellar motor protein MotB [Halovulum sp. GXIMD14793]